MKATAPVKQMFIIYPLTGILLTVVFSLSLAIFFQTFFFFKS